MSGVDPFTSSRAEVKTLTKTVAFQLADKGIRVNAIAPGLIATDSNKQLLENEEKGKEKENEIPFHRIRQPEEIAKIALFLVFLMAGIITSVVAILLSSLSFRLRKYEIPIGPNFFANNKNLIDDYKTVPRDKFNNTMITAYLRLSNKITR